MNQFPRPPGTRAVRGLAALLLAATTGAGAAPIDVVQMAAFLNAPALGAQSLEDTRIGSGFNDLGGTGLAVTFTNNLGADNTGTVTWEITNGTGTDLASARLLGFLDAEITEPGNSYFNESGALVDVSGAGTSDAAPDGWEIDEPGFVFGDIYDNLLAGALDGSNGVPAGLEDDVSLALSFDLGTVLAGESVLAEFNVSFQDIGGLRQTDPDANLTFFFNGTARVLPARVPEPASLALLAVALPPLAFAIHRRRRRRSRGGQRTT